MLTKQHYRDKSNLLTKIIEHSIGHDLTNRHYSNMLDTYSFVQTYLPDYFIPLILSLSNGFSPNHSYTKHISCKKYFSEALVLTSKFLLDNLCKTIRRWKILNINPWKNHTIRLILKMVLSCITTESLNIKKNVT